MSHFRAVSELEGGFSVFFFFFSGFVFVDSLYISKYCLTHFIPKITRVNVDIIIPQLTDDEKIK